MASKKTYEVAFRRRREGKTDYKKRLASVKGGVPRLVVRLSNKYVTAQIIEYVESGDKVIVSASSKELDKYGWMGNKNISSCYLTGLSIAKKALKANVEKVILDIGFKSPVAGSRVFSVLKGVVDGGLDVPHSADAFPSEDRISGKHIQAFASTELGKSKLGNYEKNKVDVSNLTNVFDKVKGKILNGE